MNIKEESQYLERTPDLVAKVRAMREEMQKQMDRFTRVEDYDVRRVAARPPVKHGAQRSIDFAPAEPATSDGEAS